MAESKDYETKVTADPTQFEAGMKKAAQAASDASSTIDAQFKRIGDSVTNVTKYIAGFTAVLAGGGALKKFISDANDWNSQAASMSKQLGISTEKASVLNVALNHLGIESSVYTDAAMKMSKQIQSNGQAFDVLGVKTRDATGAYRPVTEIMGEVNQKLAAIKNPIEQNIAGLQVYGKEWTAVRGILKVTAEGMAAAEVRARELGLVVGPEGAAMSKQYSTQMRDLALVGKSLEVQFGNRLLPVFTTLGKFMGEEAPAMGKVFGDMLSAVAVVAGTVWLVLKDTGDLIGSLAAQGAALLSRDMDAVRAIGKERDAEAAKNNASFQRLKAGFSMPLAPAATPPAAASGPDPQYHFKEKAQRVTTEPADKSRMSQWEADLSDRKAAIERVGMAEGQFREMSKAAELKYWTDLRGIKGLSITEGIALTRKGAEAEMAMIKQSFEVKVAALQAEAAAFKHNTDERLRIELLIQSKYQAGTKEYEAAAKHIVEIQRQALEQERTMREARVQAERDARLQGVALEEQTLHASVQLGLTTHQQLLAAQAQFEQRRNGIANEALQERLQAALLDPDRNPVEVQKINTEIEALALQHQLRLGQIRGQAMVESQRDVTGAVASIEASWGGLMSKLMQGQLTLGSFLKGAFQSVLQAVTDVLSKLAAKWLTDIILKRVLSKTSAAGQIADNAGVAGAAATASAAAIPLIGWEIAPAAGAAAFSSAMGYMGVLASAAGGYDIPGNINPIVQTHAREMILPAKIADTVRNLADSGAGTGSADGSVTHIHGSPDDTVKLRDLGRLLTKMHRNFEFVR